jgi:hypothetical protein
MPSDLLYTIDKLESMKIEPTPDQIIVDEENKLKNK